jgi:dienelactone hydrolase
MNGDTILETPFVVRNAFGDPIHGELRYRSQAPDAPPVIICHSFMAFKDWGFFPYIGRAIANAGFVAVSFNFSLNGVAAHGNRITEFHNFERNTFSRELHDLNTVVDAVAERRIGNTGSNIAKIGLLGHSRGGGIAIVHAASDARIKALTTWSSISTFDRWTEHQKERWRLLGYLPLSKETAVSPLRLGRELLEDIDNHRTEYDILQAAGLLRIPWLILHGREDVTVQPREASLLYAKSTTARTEFRMLDHVGHLYNAASKNEDNYQTLDQVVGITTQWLQRQFI